LIVYPNYIGDPINAVKIFNEKKADELFLLEINASVKKYEPNFELIKKIARESRMPICYGGGIKNLEQAKKIFNFGIEKIALSSAIFQNINIVSEISNYSGSNSTVVVLDIKKVENEYFIFIHNGKKKLDLDIVSLIKELQNLGMGEIVINSIDKDGTMQGFDYDLIDTLIDLIKVPITILGGAGSFQDIKNSVEKYGSIGISCGSLFVYKGPRKAVLLNYPKKEDKLKLIQT
jgi:cyclase